jgi:hypothetical protein
MFDPATNNMATLSASMAIGRDGPAWALVSGGKVLIAGGVGAPQQADQMIQATAELYDLATQRFTLSAGMLSTPRQPNPAVVLDQGPNAGQVLIAGGYAATGPDDSVDLYDPGTDHFSPGAHRMTTKRGSCTATLLRDGRVLFAGGNDGMPGFPIAIASAELYDPTTGMFTPTATMTVARYQHSATLLPSGKVLIAGGLTTGSNPTGTAELFDPVAGTFRPTSQPLTKPRAYQGAALLRTGKVLLVGGGELGEEILGELYDPATDSFATTTSSLSDARSIPSVTLLQDGRVLIAGGQNTTGFITTAVDLYVP